MQANTGARLVAVGPGLLRVEGPLDFSTVSGLLAAATSSLGEFKQLQIDLGGVTVANSAGLALLLQWLDLAWAREVDLRFLNLPESLQRIAAISNLDSLLPVSLNGTQSH